MSDQGVETGRDGTPVIPATHEVTPIPGGGAAESTPNIPPTTGGETTFVTTMDRGGSPPDSMTAGVSPQPHPSPDASLMESMARIEARFAGMHERQVRTEDAMAVLLSTRGTAGIRQAPPTPVYFEQAGFGSTSTGGGPGTGQAPHDPRTEGFESDSSAELERSRAERRVRTNVSGRPEQGGGGIPTIPHSAAEAGGTRKFDSQDTSQPPVTETDQPSTLTAEVVRAMTAQVTASLLARMETDEFTHRLAKRLDIQDTGPEIVNEVFRSVLTPDRYRLLDRSAVVTEAMRNTSHRAIRSMQTLMKGVPMFGGPNGRALAVIGFLTSFKAAADKALVNEGLAIEILPFFVDERVRGILRQASPMPGMAAVAPPMDYPGILKELLTSYLSEDKCEDHYRALRIATAHPWEDEEVFGRRIQELDYELGKLLGEGELRAILFAGVPNFVRISARGANTARTNFSRLMHLCKSLGDAYRVLHPECALKAKPLTKEDKGKEAGHSAPVPRPTEAKPATVLVASEMTRTDPDQGHPGEIVDQQGHLLVPATPIVDEQGTVAYIAPAGTQFHVTEGGGRRVPYVRTTGYTPITGSPYQPMPTWAVRTEPSPPVTGRPGRLGESMFRMAPGPKAFQAGTGRPGMGNTRPYGQAATRSPVGTGSTGCMLCGDTQHWVSTCPLIPEEARQAAAQRKAAHSGYNPKPQLGGAPADGARPPQQGGVMVVEEIPPHSHAGAVTPDPHTESGNE